MLGTSPHAFALSQATSNSNTGSSTANLPKWSGQWFTTEEDKMSVCITDTGAQVNAGPIWNNDDAKQKCPAIIKQQASTLAPSGKSTAPALSWNKQWRTTTEGKMSVCGTNKGFDIQAGPILNNQDAQEKCNTAIQKYRHLNNPKNTEPSRIERCKLWVELKTQTLSSKKISETSLSQWKRMADISCDRRGFFPSYENYQKRVDTPTCMQTQGCSINTGFSADTAMSMQERCILQTKVQYGLLKQEPDNLKNAWLKTATDGCNKTGQLMGYSAYKRNQKDMAGCNPDVRSDCPSNAPAVSEPITAVTMKAPGSTINDSPETIPTATNPPESTKSTLVFAGYTWQVRAEGSSGPGPNVWDSRNAWVDSNGHLHLKIANRNGQWSSAEIYMSDNQRLGFGTYQWQILGRPDLLPGDVVLGLFNYTRPDVGPDGTNEIDIEFTTWNLNNPEHGNWTVYPAIPVTRVETDNDPRKPWTVYMATQQGEQSTHRFTWLSGSILFESINGFISPSERTGVFKTWRFAPPDATIRIPQKPLPVHMNLWSVEGKAPKNGKEVEVIIKNFSFTPAQ